MAVYVVTGGAGFIGSNLVRRLLKESGAVRVVDDFSTGREQNLSGLEQLIAIWRGDICDAGVLAEAFDGADYVFHQAALASVQASMKDPVATNRVNVEGTVRVLDAARRAHVKRVVFASSCAVYGLDPELPKREDMAPAPASPYAASKLAGEHYCRAFNYSLGVETVSLRYFNVFGPRQDPSGAYSAAIPIFIRAILDGRPVRLFGDGNQSRDFVYVDDVAEANLLAARAPKPAGAVMNIGTGVRYTLNEVVMLLSNLIGRPASVELLRQRPGDIVHSEADIGRAGELIGYLPETSFEDGLRRTIEWCDSGAEPGLPRDGG